MLHSINEKYIHIYLDEQIIHIYIYMYVYTHTMPPKHAESLHRLLRLLKFTDIEQTTALHRQSLYKLSVYKRRSGDADTNSNNNMHKLIRLSKCCMNILIHQHNMGLYKRSQFDIYNNDFNYTDKYAKLAQRSPSSSSSPPLLLINNTQHSHSRQTRNYLTVEGIVSNFLSRNALLGKITRVPLPRLPKRIQTAIDTRTTLAITGYLLLNNLLDPSALHVMFNDALTANS